MFLQIEQAPLRTEQSRKGLRYFPANPRFRFTASFDPTPGEKALEMATSDGKMAPFTKFGRVMFTRHQKAYELTIYKRKNAEFYFIPFHDQTNGATTFGGGRFLGFSLSRVKDGQVVLDFNKSYNPWCHYAEKFACPLPPRSNKLDFAVLAGEKKYAPN